MKIAIVGAESTGKTELAQGLVAHWTALGQSAVAIPEVLRAWCKAHGRTPQPHEQLGIAQEQARQMLLTPTVDWLVADTSPLMTAVYSDLLFADSSLYDFALTHQRRYDLTLLTALDLPWVADGLQRDGVHVREPVDRRLRAALKRGDIAFCVIAGQGDQRLAQALGAIAQASQRDN